MSRSASGALFIVMQFPQSKVLNWSVLQYEQERAAVKESEKYISVSIVVWAFSQKQVREGGVDISGVGSTIYSCEAVLLDLSIIYI
jgi:hypothetical protein